MPFSHALVRQCVILRRARLLHTAANETKRPRGRPRKNVLLQHVHTDLTIYAGVPELAKRPRGRPRKPITPTVLDQPQVAKRGRGRPRKVSESSNATVDLPMQKSVKIGQCSAAQLPVEDTRLRKTTDRATAITRRRRRNTGDLKPVPRIALIASRQKHHDLPSFLEYAARTNLKTTTNVYRGTHYEYTVADTLKLFKFSLNRTGRANDLGIDLIGSWSLPKDAHELKVLIQCKASSPRPSMVRELEGSYIGAPAGWRGTGVMAFLVTSKPATRGVREALQRSRLPMGFLQITPDGAPKQFLWNGVAQEARLAGMTATNMYRPIGRDHSMQPVDYRGPVQSAISLLWMGRQWASGGGQTYENE